MSRAAAVLLTVALWLAPAAGADKGGLEVRLKDHREAIGDFAQLTLAVDEILISPKPGLRFWQSGWKKLPVSSSAIDLTRYTGNTSAPVFRGEIDAGAFDAVHLKLKQVTGALKKSRRSTPIKNRVGPIKLDFTVRANGETVLVLDLVVLDMSDHPPQAYELALRGYELYSDGKLIDRVPPGR